MCNGQPVSRDPGRHLPVPPADARRGIFGVIACSALRIPLQGANIAMSQISGISGFRRDAAC